MSLPAPRRIGKCCDKARPAPRLWLAVGLAALAGCRGSEPGFERYVPPPGPARAAVAAVLDAWRDGRPTEQGAGPAGDVHVVDHQRRPGQRLVGYEILGEVSGERARTFAVRLRLAEPEQTQVVRFAAVGQAPLWVFRQEDYEMIAHWMHAMDAEPGSEIANAGPAANATPNPADPKAQARP